MPATVVKDLGLDVGRKLRLWQISPHLGELAMILWMKAAYPTPLLEIARLGAGERTPRWVGGVAGTIGLKEERRCSAVKREVHRLRLITNRTANSARLCERGSGMTATSTVLNPPDRSRSTVT